MTSLLHISVSARPYLRYALTTMGLIDVDIIRLGELHRAPAKVEEAFRQAETWIADR